MKHKIQTTDAEGNQMFISIRLDDECNNGHQDFAITADIYAKGRPCNSRNWIAGGCCHEDIIAARPDLKMFVDLHLADWEGVPMYAVENGFYHLGKGFNDTPATGDTFRAKFCEYYRITPDQFDALRKCDTQIQYALKIQELGILEQWKAQANEAIKTLEQMTGETFVNTSVKSNFHVPAQEQIDAENERMASGYYTPEAKQGRAEAALQAKLAEIDAEAKAKCENVLNEAAIKKQVLSIGGEAAFGNCIVYTHTKTLKFNWLDYKKPVDAKTIAEISAGIILPEGYGIER